MISTATIVLSLVGAALTVTAHAQTATAPDSVKPKPFAFVELFTSEGCSSCPPAERVAAALVEEAAAAKKNVIVLSYHVDYWDRLGWKDPYGLKVLSDWQPVFSSGAHDGRIYTPQMIVNGREAFVGSNRAKADTAVARALRSAPREGTAIAATVELRDDGRTWRVRVIGIGSASDGWAYAALVQPEASSEVTAGENRGRTLHHVNVVRAVNRAPMRADGPATIDLVMPDELRALPKRAGAFLVVHVRAEPGGHVRAVEIVKLPPVEPAPVPASAPSADGN